MSAPALRLTVADLIEQLRTMPPDAVVLTRGYEAGLDHVDRVRLARVRRCLAPDEHPPFFGAYGVQALDPDEDEPNVCALCGSRAGDPERAVLVSFEGRIA